MQRYHPWKQGTTVSKMSSPPGRLLGFLLEAYVYLFPSPQLGEKRMNSETLLLPKVAPRYEDSETISHLLKDKRWPKVFFLHHLPCWKGHIQKCACAMPRVLAKWVCVMVRVLAKCACTMPRVLANLLYSKLLLRELKKILKSETPPTPLFFP